MKEWAKCRSVATGRKSRIRAKARDRFKILKHRLKANMRTLQLRILEAPIFIDNVCRCIEAMICSLKWSAHKYPAQAEYPMSDTDPLGKPFTTHRVQHILGKGLASRTHSAASSSSLGSGMSLRISVSVGGLFARGGGNWEELERICRQLPWVKGFRSAGVYPKHFGGIGLQTSLERLTS